MTDTHTSEHTPDAPRPIVEVLFFEGCDELDAVGPFEVLATAGFDVVAVGFPAGVRALRAAHGLNVAVERDIGDAPALLVVPGGGWLDRGPGVRPLLEDGELPRLIARLHAAGTVIASVCTGAMLLAGAGLLRGRPAVTNRLALDDLRATGADVRADARVVDDGDVITSGGPLAGIDLALRIVERHLGTPVATAVAEGLEHERRGPLIVGGREFAVSL